jgi:peptidoglycan hydrolase-like protein with peptidoglycan-binding domain
VPSADKDVFVGKSSIGRKPIGGYFSEFSCRLATGISLASCRRMQIHKETFMVRILSVVLSVLLLSACATVTEDNDTPIVETQTAAAPEIQPAESSVATPVEAPKNGLAGGPRKIPSKQEIKLLQTQLKSAGFDPGPVDGAMGARTLSALRRLQSGCSNLNDFFENSTSGISARSGDDIRLIQVRLKDAGFDVGPVDGVMGSKTKSALLRVQSGCTMVKDWSVSPDNQVQTVERMPSSMPASERALQTVPFKAAPATDSVREAGSQASALDKSPSREEIRLLQLKLKAAGFDPGPSDGVLGPKTNSALEQYRTMHGSSNSRKLSSGVRFDY